MTRDGTTRLRSWERLWRALIVVAVVGVVVWLFLIALLVALLGDREKEGLVIQNRTDQTILVYSVYVDGSEHRAEGIFPPIPPHTRFESDLPCGAGGLAARTQGGKLLSRRGPFDECELEDWIIDPRR
jgi:hypothetical protein